MLGKDISIQRKRIMGWALVRIARAERCVGVAVSGSRIKSTRSTPFRSV